MTEESLLNLLTLQGIQKRVYSALVRKASLLHKQDLVTEIRSIASTDDVAAVSKAKSTFNYKLSSCMDALALKMGQEEFNDFIHGF